MISPVKSFSLVQGRIRRFLYLHIRPRLLPLSRAAKRFTNNKLLSPSSVSRYPIGCGDSGGSNEEIWLVKRFLDFNRTYLFWCCYWSIRTRRHEGNDGIGSIVIQSETSSKEKPATWDHNWPPAFCSQQLRVAIGCASFLVCTDTVGSPAPIRAGDLHTKLHSEIIRDNITLFIDKTIYVIGMTLYILKTTGILNISAHRASVHLPQIQTITPIRMSFHRVIMRMLLARNNRKERSNNVLKLHFYLYTRCFLRDMYAEVKSYYCDFV